MHLYNSHATSKLAEPKQPLDCPKVAHSIRFYLTVTFFFLGRGQRGYNSYSCCTVTKLPSNFKPFFLFSSFSFHYLVVAFLYFLLSIILFLFSPSQPPQQHTGRRQCCSLPPFPYQSVFILQVEVGDLFSMGCYMLFVSPTPPPLLAVPLHPLFIYAHPPSLISKHPEVGWEGSGTRKASLGSGVTIITWLTSNS